MTQFALTTSAVQCASTMKTLIIVTVLACGLAMCHCAPTSNSIVAVRAEEIPLQDVKNVQFNVARVLDRSLASITFADCMKFLSESLDKNVKPLVDGWGKFSLRNLLVDWHQRKQEMVAKVHHQGEAIISNVHHKGGEIIKDVHDKKEEIISNVHHKGEELLNKKKQIISNVQHKGEELLAKKKQVLVDVQHTGEHLIEEVLDGAKKKIADLKKPLYDESSRRKREAENLEALADLLEDEAAMQELNEVDTKMLNDVDPHTSYKKPAIVKPKPIAVLEPEYYTLPELAGQFLKWARKTFSLRRLLKRPTVVVA